MLCALFNIRDQEEYKIIQNVSFKILILIMKIKFYLCFIQLKDKGDKSIYGTDKKWIGSLIA